MFSARLVNQPTFSSGQRVIFDYVISNVGNAYDSDTGVFTVTYNGTYELTLTNHSQTKVATSIIGPGGRLCQAYTKEGLITGKFKYFYAV